MTFYFTSVKDQITQIRSSEPLQSIGSKKVFHFELKLN
jgi:hypothetical protein